MSLGDMFLMVKGTKHGLIKGEALDDSHKGEIEVLSWSWGMEQRTDAVTGATRGKSTIHDLKIVKGIDAASVPLMMALRQNEIIEKAVLTLRKGGGKTALEYLKIIIGNGRVTSLTVSGGDPAGSAKVVEHVTFGFNKVEIQYTGQNKDGLPLGAMSFEDEWQGAT